MQKKNLRLQRFKMENQQEQDHNILPFLTSQCKALTCGIFLWKIDKAPLWLPFMRKEIIQIKSHISYIMTFFILLIHRYCSNIIFLTVSQQDKTTIYFSLKNQAALLTVSLILPFVFPAHKLPVFKSQRFCTIKILNLEQSNHFRSQPNCSSNHYTALSRNFPRDACI